MLKKFDPQNKIIYCPACGKIGLEWKSTKSMICRTCGFQMYINVAAAAAAIIPDGENRILLTKRLWEPAAGTFDLPGGFIDPDETAEEGLKREVREELNLAITETNYFQSFPNIYTYNGLNYATLDLVFICKVTGFKNLHPGDDISDVIFKKPGDINLDEIGLASIKTALARYQQYIGNNHL